MKKSVYFCDRTYSGTSWDQYEKRGARIIRTARIYDDILDNILVFQQAVGSLDDPWPREIYPDRSGPPECWEAYANGQRLCVWECVARAPTEDERDMARKLDHPPKQSAHGDRSEKAKRAGSAKAKVKHAADRHKICMEVKRLSALPGMTLNEAYRQAAQQAVNGRAGKTTLTMKYNVPEVTRFDVRRLCEKTL